MSLIADRTRGPVGWWALAVALLAAASCGGNDAAAPQTLLPTDITDVSGNGQVGLVGTSLAAPLVVRVSSHGQLVSGAPVTFAVTSGAASVSPATTTSDANGQAKTTVLLGSTAGNVSVTATVAGTISASFVVTAAASVLTQACISGAATTPAVGAVVAGAAGSGICLSGGTAGAEYALVAFYGNSESGTNAALTVQSHGGVTAVTSASLAPPFAETQARALQQMGEGNPVQARFDAQLRAGARRDLTALIPAARATYRRSAAFTAIPSNPAIGSLVTLNANGQVTNPGGPDNTCTVPINVTARVAAVSNLAIVVADTTNPAGGFSDAEYASFAATFDTLVSPLDIANFGQPTDIDGNGKTIIFFTKEVNRLTPRGSAGVIGGFFHERDLFPVKATGDLQACPTSNFAEMYYSLVPDPTGLFSDPRSKALVQLITPGTLVHEFQHLINAGRRLYVNNADVLEEVWLNEGLSHIAEELLYYHAARLQPRGNLGIGTIAADAADSAAWTNYQRDNSGRFQVFLGTVPHASPYTEDDSLWTRGATWNLLRYLADHQGSSDGTVWMQLDNSTTSGQQNLANVFTSDRSVTSLIPQIRDWATSIFADDVPGMTDARYADLSWNMRSIYPRLVNGSGASLNVYPLNVLPLSDAQQVSTSILAGGAAYITFGVPAGKSGSIDWSSSGLPASALMQFSVVRTK